MTKSEQRKVMRVYRAAIWRFQVETSNTETRKLYGTQARLEYHEACAAALKGKK